MLLTLLFLVLLAITLVLAGLQLIGYQVIESLIVIVIVDFIALGANIEQRRKNISKDSDDIIVSKLENIEGSCSDILEHLTSNPVGNFKKEKDSINYLLDKLAKKSLELEEKLEKFGSALTTAMSEMNGRIKTLETSSIPGLEEEPKIVEGEKKIPLGELVYIDEDNE